MSDVSVNVRGYAESQDDLYIDDDWMRRAENYTDLAEQSFPEVSRNGFDDSFLVAEAPPDDMKISFVVYSFDTSTAMDKQIAGHWYYALKDLDVEPGSDNSRYLAHLMHLIKILQQEQIVVGPFRNLPNYHVRKNDYKKLKNYMEISEQKLYEMIKEERGNRFQSAVHALQQIEERPEEDWNSCYVLVQDDTMENHYFHFPPHMLKKVDAILNLYKKEIQRQIQDVRDAKKISLDIPKSPKDWADYPDEFAQFHLDMQRFAKSSQSEHPKPATPRRPKLYVCYLPVGTDTDQRIILNWISIVEDLEPNHSWKSYLLEILGFMEEARIAISPFNKIPQRPFHRGQLPPGFDRMRFPTQDEVWSTIQQTQKDRVQFLSNFLWESGQLQEYFERQEGDSVAFVYEVRAQAYPFKCVGSREIVNQILTQNEQKINQFVGSHKVHPAALRAQVAELQEKVTLVENKMEKYSALKFPLVNKPVPEEIPIQYQDRTLWAEEVRDIEAELALKKRRAEAIHRQDERRLQPGAAPQRFDLGVTEREAAMLYGVTPMAGDLLSRWQEQPRGPRVVVDPVIVGYDTIDLDFGSPTRQRPGQTLQPVAGNFDTTLSPRPRQVAPKKLFETPTRAYPHSPVRTPKVQFGDLHANKNLAITPQVKRPEALKYTPGKMQMSPPGSAYESAQGPPQGRGLPMTPPGMEIPSPGRGLPMSPPGAPYRGSHHGPPAGRGLPMTPPGMEVPPTGRGLPITPPGATYQSPRRSPTPTSRPPQGRGLPMTPPGMELPPQGRGLAFSPPGAAYRSPHSSPQGLPPGQFPITPPNSSYGSPRKSITSSPVTASSPRTPRRETLDAYTSPIQFQGCLMGTQTSPQEVIQFTADQIAAQFESPFKYLLKSRHPIFTAEQIEVQFGQLGEQVSTGIPSPRQVEEQERQDILNAVKEMEPEEVKEMARPNDQARRIMREREKRKMRLNDPNWRGSSEELDKRGKTVTHQPPPRAQTAAAATMFGSPERTTVDPEVSRQIQERMRLKRMGLDPDQEARDAAYRAQMQEVAANQEAAAARKAAMQGTSLRAGPSQEQDEAPQLTYQERKRLKQQEADRQAREMYEAVQRDRVQSRAQQSTLGRGYFANESQVQSEKVPQERTRTPPPSPLQRSPGTPHTASPRTPPRPQMPLGRGVVDDSNTSKLIETLKLMIAEMQQSRIETRQQSRMYGCPPQNNADPYQLMPPQSLATVYPHPVAPQQQPPQFIAQPTKTSAEQMVAELVQMPASTLSVDEPMIGDVIMQPEFQELSLIQPVGAVTRQPLMQNLPAEPLVPTRTRPNYMDDDRLLAGAADQVAQNLAESQHRVIGDVDNLIQEMDKSSNARKEFSEIRQIEK